MPQEVYTNCRFYVQINEIPQAIFTEVTGLQIETTVMDYEEGGNNRFVHRLPGRTKIGNLTLKRGMTRSHEFFKWYSGNISGGKFVRRNLSVIMYDGEGKPLLRWNFIKAYPVKWIGPQLSADGKTMAIETLELAHSGLELG